MEKSRTSDSRKEIEKQDEMDVDHLGVSHPDRGASSRQTSSGSSMAISNDQIPSSSNYIISSSAAKIQGSFNSIPWMQEPKAAIDEPTTNTSQQVLDTNVQLYPNPVVKAEKENTFKEIFLNEDVGQTGFNTIKRHPQEHKSTTEINFNDSHCFPDSCLSSRENLNQIHHAMHESKKVDSNVPSSGSENMFGGNFNKYHISIPNRSVEVIDGAMEDCSTDRKGFNDIAAQTAYTSDTSIFEDAEEETIDIERQFNESTKPAPQLGTSSSCSNGKDASIQRQLPNKSSNSSTGSINSGVSTCSKDGTQKKKSNDKRKSNVSSSVQGQSSKKSGKNVSDTDGKKKKMFMGLFGTKEQKEAVNILSRVDDLSKILPHEHCIFLGKLWIFTIQQLDCVINGQSNSSSPATKVEERVDDSNLDMSNSSFKANKELLEVMMAEDTFLQNYDDCSKDVHGARESVTTTCLDAVSSKEHNFSLKRLQEYTEPCNNAPTKNNENASCDLKQTDKKYEPAEDQKESTVEDTEPPNLESSIPSSSVRADSDELSLQKKIERCICSWNDAIKTWKETKTSTAASKGAGEASQKSSNQGGSRVDESFRNSDKDFSLFGAISTLLPQYILKFLPSVGIRNAFAFLSAKKTENSFLIHALSEWRKQQYGSDLKMISLARHMIGISARISAALSSIPPADSFTRKWMGGALIVLTGSPREFVVFDRRITSIDELLTTKTKCLAEKFATWRETKNMQPLKGTGNVATISTWKTMVKEANEADFSVCQVEQPIKQNSVAHEVPEGGKNDTISIVNETNPSVDMVLPEKYLNLDCSPYTKKDIQCDDEGASSMVSQILLKSPEFLQDVLKPANIEFLAKNGIYNVDDLIACDKQVQSPVVVSMLEWRSKQSSSNIQVSSCIRSLYEWGQKAKDEIDKFGGDGQYHLKKRGRPRGAFKKAADQTKRSSDEVGEQDMESDSESIHEICENPKSSDPISALSKVTKNFLFSHGITSSEQLLSTKTSVLAETYVRWRAKQGMTELKGQGSWSSISGWKATVRGAARTQGMHHLLNIVPNTSVQSTSLSSREEKTAAMSGAVQKSKYSAKNSNKNTFVTHPRILFGLPFCTFSVCSANQDALYDFSLSIRKANSSSSLDDFSVYLTYLGGRVCLEKSTTYHETTQPAPFSSAKVQNYHVLRDSTAFHHLSPHRFVAVDYISFCTTDQRCGLIDLSPYGAFPSSTKNRVDDLNTILTQFISNGPLPEKMNTEEFQVYRCDNSVDGSSILGKRKNGNKARNIKSSESNIVLGNQENKIFPKANVLVLPNDDGGVKYMLHIDEHIEKGQTVELHLDQKVMKDVPGNKNVKSNRTSTQERQMISKIISSLSISEMHEVLEYIHDGLLCSILHETETIQKLLMDKDEGKNDLSEASTVNTSKCLITRRRIHWISEQINAHRNFLSSLCLEYRDLSFKFDEGDTKQYLKNMQWENFLCEGEVPFLDQNKGRLFKILQNEITEELLALANGLRVPFDKSMWCPLSSSLLKDLLDHFSAYKLVQPSCTLTSQKELLKKICSRVSEAIDLLNKCCNASTLEGEINLFDLESLAFSSNCRRIVGSEDKEHYRCKGGQVTTMSDRLNKNKGIAATDLKAYEDALSLCDEVKFEIDDSSNNEQHLDNDEHLTIITKNTENKERHLTSTCLRGLYSDGNEAEETLNVVQGGCKCIHREWYLYNQIFFVVYSLAFAAVKEWINDLDSCNNALKHSLPSWFKESLSDTFKYDFVRDPLLLLNTLSVEHVPLPTFPMGSTPKVKSCSTYFPKSQPLFLKIIWPRLRTDGWRMDFDARDPEKISYLSPGMSISRKRKMDADSSHLRDRENARKKSKVLDELSKASILNIPRSIKFILISSLECMSQMEEIEDDGSFPVLPSRSVKRVLEKYVESVRMHFESKSKLEVWQKTRSIIDGLLTYFDEFIPSLLFAAEKSRHGNITDGRRNSDLYGCEYLLRIVLFLPRLLHDMAMSSEETKKISFVLEDLLNFLASNCVEFFDDMFLPSTKETQESKQNYRCILDNCFDFPRRQSHTVANDETEASSACRNERTMSGDSKKERCPLVSAEDKPILTLFTYLAMSQFVVAHADRMDLLKGKRKSCLRIGFPGIGCGHCLDFIDDGNKYFFNSVESLATAPSIVANHLQRCSFCPDDVKQKLRSYRLRHAEQRKTLPHGSQSIFFNRVWKRLFSSPLPEEPSEKTNTVNQPDNIKNISTDRVESQENSPDEKEPSSSERIFQSHIEVMKFIGQTKEQSDDIILLLRQYYACLARGGQLWNTDSMPMQFSSEWLLKEHRLYKTSRR